MRAAAYATENCSIARALGVVGEKWTFLVLREVFRGVRRFDEIRACTGVPRQVLSERLGRLVALGILRRVPYQEPGRRARDEYRLTEKGFELYPILLALLAWGDRHVAAPDGPALRAVHRDCGADVRLRMTCDAGHDLTSPRDVVPRPGPGARLAAPPACGASAQAPAARAGVVTSKTAPTAGARATRPGAASTAEASRRARATRPGATRRRPRA